MTNDFSYQGSELELFARAANWKSYWASAIRPYVGKRVLEVGAGLGATANQLCDGRQTSWVALEPDAAMAEQMRRDCAEGGLPQCLNVFNGTVDTLSTEELFDTVLYIDVLEHIENDHQELDRASARLDSGGYLVVLAPAHQFLFSPFDRAIGHFRRYSRRSIGALQPKGTVATEILYLDSVGLIASLGNRCLLKASMPTRRQIEVWDRFMVPVSRVLDPLTAHSVGKSVLAVWQRT